MRANQRGPNRARTVGCVPGTRPRTAEASKRRGAVSTLDYVLILGVVLPLATFTLWAGPRIVRLAFEMVHVLVTWPFM